MSSEKTLPRSKKPLEIELFGELTLVNFLDWIVTGLLCLILVTVGLSYGGSHVELQVYYLPLFALLLVFHGLYLVSSERPLLQVNTLPLLFIPFMLWLWFSTLFMSPSPLIAWQEFIFALEAFIFLWVATNNLKKRVHFSMLLVCAIFPVIIALLVAFYQFFQQPNYVFEIFQDSGASLHPEVLGRSTGIFADPESLAILFLIVLPWAFLVTAVPRLPMVLRVLGFYILIALFVGLILSQTFWSLLVALVGCLTAVMFCFEKQKSRLRASLYSVLSAGVLMVFFVTQFGRIGRSFDQALSIAGEGGRLFIWEQTLWIILKNPIFGGGAGSFQHEYEQATKIGLTYFVESPLSDLLLLLVEFGLFGLILLMGPIYILVSRAFERWFREPNRVILKDTKKKVMPPQRFFLTIALGGVFASFECFVLARIWTTPLLLFYNAIFLSILIKSTKGTFIEIKKSAFSRSLTVGICVFAGVFLMYFFNPIARSAGLTHDAMEKVNLGLSTDLSSLVSTDTEDALKEDLQEALRLYPKNGAALLGMCVLQLQKYNAKPSEHIVIGKAAAGYALRALELNPNNWRGWSYLGMAESMKGNYEQAEEAFLEAIKWSPSNGNALYYYAAFLAQLPERQSEALKVVEQSLYIYPTNAAALRLKQKLLID